MPPYKKTLHREQALEYAKKKKTSLEVFRPFSIWFLYCGLSYF